MVDERKIAVHEDETTQRAREWWQKNRVSIIVGLVLGLSIVFGVNYWRTYQTNQAADASEVYSQLVSAVQNEEIDQVGELSTQLKADYSGTDYASKGLLLAAVAMQDNKQDDKAIEALTWVLEQSNDVVNEHLARIQLIRVYLSQDNYDSAKPLAMIENQGGFVSQYEEFKGDIFHQQGDTDKAKEAYQKSLDTLKTRNYSEILEAKINRYGA